MTPTPALHYAHNGDVRLAYETFGDLEAGEPLLLIMGLDFQMLWWHDDFCRALVDRGFAVVRFDNRDAGLSTHFSSPEVRRPWRAQLGLVPPAYTVLDMVEDGLAVMDAVGWSSAHILGGSLGGLLAQATGLLHPERVRSVVSALAMPAGTGPVRTLTYLRLGTILRLARAARKATTDEEQIEELLAAYRLLAGAGEGFDEDWARATARRSHERAPQDPTATQRHMSAGRGVKLPPLSSLRAPLLVINGERDPLVKPSAGRATARRVPGACFVAYPGMAHAFPRPLWPPIIAEIVAMIPTPKGHER
jgi:pimeloyl-ACP methyl ester carboxylesterase